MLAGAGILASAIGIAVLISPAHADDIVSVSGGVGQAMDFVVTLLSKLVYWIVVGLFNLNALLAFLLIKFASYNDFVQAKPVEIGWVLVRDVVNMFFIVVLLIVSFSTIIGYKDFHYKSILPKLLLMAVLINFSKTLIGVLIDFSQVITLTFVNGFAAAAFGNFAKAFGLTNMLSTSKGLQASSGTTPSVGASSDPQDGPTSQNVLLALIFAVVLLTISATTLLIMSLYFLARIVYLWLLLIFSPIAFFATALPGKMAKALGSFTSDWWSQLSAWLTGGPTVAFFLWLSLAVVQGEEKPFSTLTQSSDSSEANQYAATISAIGQPDNIGLFFVSIAMMLIGVQQAVKVSGAASKELGGLATRIRATGGPAAVIGGFAARQAGRATSSTARRVDRRYGITAGLSRGLRTAGAAIGARGGVVGGVVGTAVQLAGQRVAKVPQGYAAEAQKSVTEAYGKLGTADRLQAIQTELAQGPLLDIVRKGVLEKEQTALLMKGDGVKAYEAAEKAKLPAGMPETDKDAMAKARAAQNVGKELSRMQKETKDGELKEKIAEHLKKRPDMQGSIADIAKSAKDGDIKDVAAEAYADSVVGLSVLKSRNLYDEKSGGMVAGYEDKDEWKELVKHGGSRAEFMRAHAQQLATLQGQDRARKILGGDEASRYRLNSDSQGVTMAFANSVTSLGKGTATGAARFASNDQVVQQIADPSIQRRALDALNRLSARPDSFNTPMNATQASELVDLVPMYTGTPPAGGYSNVQMHDIADAHSVGVPSAISFNYDADTNTFRSPEAQKAASTMYADQLTEANSTSADDANLARNFIANTDRNLVAREGEFRDMITDALSKNTDKIRTMLEDKRTTKEQGKKVVDMIKTMLQQAETVQDRGGANTVGEKSLVEFRDKVMSDKVLDRIIGKKKKTP